MNYLEIYILIILGAVIGVSIIDCRKNRRETGYFTTGAESISNGIFTGLALIGTMCFTIELIFEFLIWIN